MPKLNKEQLKEMFPKYPLYFSWASVPTNLHTKTQLQKAKLWREDLQPVAVKGNVQSKAGYYFLYQDDTLIREND